MTVSNQECLRFLVLFLTFGQTYLSRIVAVRLLVCALWSSATLRIMYMFASMLVELPRAAQSCLELLRATQSCQELLRAAQCCPELPGAAQSCQFHPPFRTHASSFSWLHPSINFSPSLHWFARL